MIIAAIILVVLALVVLVKGIDIHKSAFWGPFWAVVLLGIIASYIF